MKLEQPLRSRRYYFARGDNFRTIGCRIGMSANALATFNIGSVNPNSIARYLRHQIKLISATPDGNGWMFDPAIQTTAGQPFIFVPLRRCERRSIVHHYQSLITQPMKTLAGGDQPAGLTLSGYADRIWQLITPHERRERDSQPGTALCGSPAGALYGEGASAAQTFWQSSIESAVDCFDAQTLPVPDIAHCGMIRLDLVCELRRLETNRLHLALTRACKVLGGVTWHQQPAPEHTETLGRHVQLKTRLMGSRADQRTSSPR